MSAEAEPVDPPVGRKRKRKATAAEQKAKKAAEQKANKAAERKKERESRNANFREDGWDPTELAFTQTHVGPRKEAFSLAKSTNPMDFFNLFLTDDLLDVLVTETNRYATQFLSQEARLEEERRAKAEVCCPLYPYFRVQYFL